MSRTVVTPAENLSPGVAYKCAITASRAVDTDRMRSQLASNPQIRTGFLSTWQVTPFQGGAVTTFDFSVTAVMRPGDFGAFATACAFGAGATVGGLEVTREQGTLESLRNAFEGQGANGSTSGGRGFLDDVGAGIRNATAAPAAVTGNVALIAIAAVVGFFLYVSHGGKVAV